MRSYRPPLSFLSTIVLFAFGPTACGKKEVPAPAPVPAAVAPALVP